MDLPLSASTRSILLKEQAKQDECMLQSKRNRSPDHEEDDDDNVSMESPRLKQHRFRDDEDLSPPSSETETHRNSELRREEECTAVLVKEQSIGECLTDDEDPFTSSSKMVEEEEESEKEIVAAARILLLLRRDHWLHQTQTQTQTQTQKELETKTETQTEVEIQSKSNSYYCSVCGKGFATFQALGGHKASHRLNKPSIACDKMEITEDARDKARRRIMLSASGKIHKCSICHRVFPTGQSLGGHKRLHYEGVLGGRKLNYDGDKTSSSNESVETNVSDQKQRVLRLIDLNKTPSPELDSNGGDDSGKEAEELE